MKYKIGIAGIGVLGTALSKVFKNPILYDPGKKLGSIDKLNKADVIFICVPTPFTGYCNTDIVEEVISQIEGEKIIVIKSTVVPGTTDYLQSKYSQHEILFNPEFLVEKTAIWDMKHPDRQIVGFTNISERIVIDIMNILPVSKYDIVMPAKEAELIKYFGNTFLAMKVSYANQMYDLCNKVGINYEMVKDAAALDPRIGPSHLNIINNGYRGFGNFENSKCLPKDLMSLIHYAKINGVEMKLLQTVKEVNDDLLKMQNLRECPE